MPQVRAEEELRTLAQCHYVRPAETLRDIQKVRALYSDLRLHVDFYCFPNNTKKKLVYLTGTLPVHYEGSTYNIPVCIWLHETHPVSRPRCYVCPSVSMMINPSCPCVDASGNISVNGLKNWTYGVSDLSQLVSEIRQAFRLDTPLYATCPVQAPPPAGVQVSEPGTSGGSERSSSSCQSAHRVSQREQRRPLEVRRSYTEELLGIDFSAPPPCPSSSNHSDPSTSCPSSVLPLASRMGALRLNGYSGNAQQQASPVHIVQSEAVRSGRRVDSGQEPEADHMNMSAQLPPEQAAIFLSLLAMEGANFNPTDVMEAVQLNKDLTSALRFLTHSCPICQEQVTFSKIITMTHCSCFLCQTCFKTFYSAAIKERSIDQLVCPQCGRPEVRGQGRMEEYMDYFNLLDTQIRHFLPPQVHELFQRKLRDRALQEMPNFCWCAHCSFGMLHEAERLRMDCPSCGKSTCSQCRSPWSPQHQGLSCEQFRLWQQHTQMEPHSTTLCSSSIECPNCQFVFSLSKGGCLHFTCSQCQHQFCGGCSQTFALGSDCGFFTDCGTKGLHAHHPRDCLYHLRDWSVSRLQRLLQYYRAAPSWLESEMSPDTSLTGSCWVLEVKDDDISRREEPCGKPALPGHRGFCQIHYKEHLVERINWCHADPAVLFSLDELLSELQRWHVAVPSRKPEEPETRYTQRLRLTLSDQVPLKKNGSLKT